MQIPEVFLQAFFVDMLVYQITHSFLKGHLQWKNDLGLYSSLVLPRIHNIRERGEYLMLYWLCKTHCIKLLHHLSDILV